MPQHTIHFWLIGRPEAEADAAYEAGLTDGAWIKKGGMMFVEFTREGETPEAVAAGAAADLRAHSVPFDERTLNLTDPTGHLEEHPGWYDDEELREVVDELAGAIAGGHPTDEDRRRHDILKRNLEAGNKA